MKKNMKHPQHSVCFQERPLVIAVRHALPYLVGLSLALAMVQNASSRSSDSAAAFTATQLVRQFTLKNTVSQVSMGMQGYLSEVNGEQRGPAMGARPAGFPSDMGSVPATVNLPRRDGAGRPLGYCAWDNAAAVTSADYNAGQGVSNPLVYAIVSPGLNGNMQTTCANVLAAGVGVGDDHVQVVAPMQVSSVQYKSSVATFSDLPPGAEGDIRLVRDTNKLYSYVGGAWAPVQAGPFEADAAGGVGAISYTTGKVTVADFQASTATITGATTIAGALSGSSATFTGAVTANTFTGNGAGLVDLNADNFSTGVVSPQFGGTGVNGAAAANGTLLIGNGSGFTLGTLTAGAGISVLNDAGAITIGNNGVISITGTADQVIASASNGNVVLSLPQAIAPTSMPTFAGMMLNGGLTGTTATFTGAVTMASLAAQRLDVATSAGGVANRNMIIGADAMPGVQSGNGGNTALGIKTLVANTTGRDNTASGFVALNFNTTGSFNTATGRGALELNTTGYQNTASGMNALIGNTTGFDNTALGSRSGFANTTGSNNTFLGSFADATTGALTYATAIGAGSTVATSSTLALGRNSAVDQVVIGTDTRNNTYANTKLYVNGVTNLNGDLRGTTATFSGAVNALSFAGDGSGLTNLNANNFNTGILPVARGGTGLSTAAANGQLLIGNGTGYSLNTLTGTANQVNVTNGAGTITLSLPQNIATTSTPTFGGITSNGTVNINNSTVTFNNVIGDKVNLWTGFGFGINADNLTAYIPGAAQRFSLRTGGTYTGSEVFTVTGGGLITSTGGISTTTGAFSGNTTVGGNLTVTGSSNLNGPVRLAGGAPGQFIYIGQDNPGGGTGDNVYMRYYARPSEGENTTFVIGTDSVDAGDHFALMPVNGNVGIGTVTPAAKLDVVGTARFSGNTTVGGTLGVTGAATFSSLANANAGLEVATGQELRLGTYTENSDGMFITRVNPAADQSIFRISAFENVSDFGGPGVDEFQIGRSTSDRLSFTPMFRLAGSGNAILGGTLTANGFSGNGSALTNLNASNFTTGTMPVARGGTGLSATPTNGQLLIGNGTGYTLGTLTGTANQVNVSNGAGTITLSLPQNIATTSTPTFGGQTLTGALTGTSASFSGDVTASTLQSFAFKPITSQGAHLQWNRDGGSGRTYLVNQKGGGGGGISFGEATTGNVYTQNMLLDALGNLTVVGSVTANSVQAGAGNFSSMTLTGALTGTSATFGGDVTTGALQANASKSITSQGTHIQWNRSGGDGRSYFVNQKGLGSAGGMSFGEATTSNVYTQNMLLDASGNLSVVGSVTANSMQTGNMTLTGALTGTTAAFSSAVVGNTLKASLFDAINSQGAYLQWNRGSGDGRTYLVNQRGGGSGGISFGESTTGNAYTENMALSSTGNLTVVGAVTANSFSGNGSGLTNLNASNFTTGTVPVARGGTGLDGSAAANGSLLIGNGTGYSLNTLTGTANQVNVTNGAGTITLSLPQNIATTSTPTFGGITSNGAVNVNNSKVVFNNVLGDKLNLWTDYGFGINGNNLTAFIPSATQRFSVRTGGTYTGTEVFTVTGGGLITSTGGISTTTGAFSGNTTVGGTLAVTGSTTLNGAVAVNNSEITFNDILGDKLNLYTGYGFGINGGNLTAYVSGGADRFSVRTGGTYTGTEVFTVTGGGLITSTGGISTTTGVFSGAVTMNSLTAQRIDVSTSAGGVSFPNMIVGTGAIAGVQSGTGANTALGINALNANTTGYANTSSGYRTLEVNTSGYGNTANGSDVLRANTTGYNNTASGYFALSNNTTGFSNTATGRLSGAINTTGSNNTFLGAAADATTGALTYATAIGASSTVATSNTLALGRNSTVDQVVIGTSTRNDTIANTKLYVNGPTNLNGSLTGTSATFSGNTTVGGTLGVTGATTLTGALTANGGISSTTGAFSGLASAASLQATTATSINQQGAYLQWNRDGGRTFLVNQKGLGSGGISFGEVTTGNAYTENMALSSTGNLTVVGAVTANSFSGNGSALTNLNASNFTTGTVPVARGGTGLSATPTNGQLLIGNGTGYILGTLTGTANQVNVINGAGSITLSLPQAIATTSTPTFGGMTLNGGLAGTTATFSGAVTVSSLEVERLDVGTVAGGVTFLNMIVGKAAMLGVQSGEGANSAVGPLALRDNTSGGRNTATGYASMAQNTTGTGNSALGLQSLVRNTTGGNNTAVGYLSGDTNTTGGNNTFLGAGSDATTGALTYATAIGADSLVASSDTLALGRNSTVDQVVIGTSTRNDTIANTKLYVNGVTNLNGDLRGTTSTFSGNMMFGTNGSGNTSLRDLRIYSNPGAAFGAWDHLQILADVQGPIINAGGAETGIRFRVGNASSGDVGGQTYNTVLTLAPNQSATFAGAVTTGGLLAANAGMQMPTDQTFRFGVLNENTDDITISRLYRALDESLLRIVIGDNAGSFESDVFQIGSMVSGAFTNAFRVAPGSGDVVAKGYVQATSFNVSSDRRLKKNINAQDNNSVLDRLERLQTYSYEYINNPAVGRRIGVIAQEVQTLFPEAAIISAENGMMSVDYGALGAMAAMGVGQLNSKFKVLDGKVNLQGEKLLELDGKVAEHNTRIGSLEGWKTEAVKRMDGMQGAIDLNIQKIAENAVAIQTNTKAIERLDDALFTLDGTVKGNTESIANINARWARNFTAAEDGSSITVNAVELKVSNFTAQQVRTNSVYTQRLEAEIARIADLEVNNLRANSAVANTVQAEQLNTGSVQVYAGVGLPAILFAAKADGHYTVSTSSLDGSYATATVIVNAGQAKVVSGASEGIELVAEGNMVKAIAAGKSIKASWIKMG